MAPSLWLILVIKWADVCWAPSRTHGMSVIDVSIVLIVIIINTIILAWLWQPFSVTQVWTSSENLYSSTRGLSCSQGLTPLQCPLPFQRMPGNPAPLWWFVPEKQAACSMRFLVCFLEAHARVSMCCVALKISPEHAPISTRTCRVLGGSGSNRSEHRPWAQANQTPACTV